MSALREVFVAVGCSGVATCLQTGNVTFDSRVRPATELRQAIQRAARDRLGSNIDLVFRTVEDVEALIRDAPFNPLEMDRGVKFYVAFLFEEPTRSPSFPFVSEKEELYAEAMKDDMVYVVSKRKRKGSFGFPNNFVEQELGVKATTRNISTLVKLVELARQT